MLRSRTSRQSLPRRLVRRVATGLVLALGALAVIQGLSAPSASADPTGSAWASLRRCESGGNYAVVARNGHYGAYQFDRSTWRSVGGTGSPERASRLEQDYRALTLYRMRGWQPWTCARKLGLREDGAARSKTLPTYAEARAVSGATGTTPTPTPTPAPTPAPTPTSSGTAWPGVVYTSGDCASGLRTFQRRMNAIGSPYRFTATGCYAARTRSAVVALQKANGVKASGILGPKTWNAAFHGTSPWA